MKTPGCFDPRPARHGRGGSPPAASPGCSKARRSGTGGHPHPSAGRRGVGRALALLGVSALAALMLTTVASATPVVTFKAEAVPIPGFPNTGLKFGAGAAIKAEYTIKGSEYEGSPPPLEGINFYLPAGTKLHTSGFPTCPTSVLEPAGVGPSGCKKASRAGPVGEVRGFVSLGGERVHENASVESFYAPGGGLQFLTAGHTPVSLEILSVGHYAHLGGAAGFGPELIAEVPLVASVPGAPYASVESLKVQSGSAMKSKGKTIYYGTVPRTCPKKYFPVKSELIFAGVGGLPKQTVVKTYKSRCPRKR